jgi:hypothetical protein
MKLIVYKIISWILFLSAGPLLAYFLLFLFKFLLVEFYISCIDPAGCQNINIVRIILVGIFDGFLWWGFFRVTRRVQFLIKVAREEI